MDRQRTRWAWYVAAWLAGVLPAPAHAEGAACVCPPAPERPAPRVLLIIDASESMSAQWDVVEDAVSTVRAFAGCPPQGGPDCRAVDVDPYVFWTEGVSTVARFEAYVPRDPIQRPKGNRGTPLPQAIDIAAGLLKRELGRGERPSARWLPTSCRPLWIVVLSDGFPRYGAADPRDKKGRAPNHWTELQQAIGRAAVTSFLEDGRTSSVSLPVRFLVPSPLLPREAGTGRTGGDVRFITDLCSPGHLGQPQRGRSPNCSSELVGKGRRATLLDLELKETVSAASSCFAPPRLELVAVPRNDSRKVAVAVRSQNRIVSLSYGIDDDCRRLDPSPLTTIAVSGAPGQTARFSAAARDVYGNCGQAALALDWPSLAVSTSLTAPSAGDSFCGPRSVTGFVHPSPLPASGHVVISGIGDDSRRIELGRGPLGANGSFDVVVDTRLLVDGPTIIGAVPEFATTGVKVIAATQPVNVRNDRVRTSLEDVVALGRSGSWHCSGVLVTPRHVLTAAHCLPVTQVLFGEDVGHPTDVVAAVEGTRAPGGADLALVRLARPAAVSVRRLRTDPPLPSQFQELAHAGFGARNPDGTNDYGHKHFMWAPEASLSCQGADCDPRWEFELSGGGGRDTCDGDSGGPVFERTRRADGCPGDEDPEQVRLDWRLVGITSRARTGARERCGEGGVYTRVDPFGAWIARTTGLTTKRGNE